MPSAPTTRSPKQRCPNASSTPRCRGPLPRCGWKPGGRASAIRCSSASSNARSRRTSTSPRRSRASRRQRQSLESPLGALASAHPGYQRDASLYDSGIGASWELDLAGGLRRGAEAFAAEAQAAEAEHAGVRISIAAEAADAYFRVRAAQARLAVAQSQLDTDRELLSLVRMRLSQGMSTARERAQAEARVAQVEGTLPALQAERDTQLNRLDVLMAATPGTHAAELATPAARVVLPALATALTPGELLRRRPDVIAAERRLAASSARIGVATAEYYPSVSLSALLGFESLRTATPSSANFQPLAAVGLHWRLFDFGRVDAEVAKAEGAKAEALARYRQSLLRATEDVENALIRQGQLDAERLALLQEVDADVRARGATQQAYAGGAVSLLELLEQDRQLLAARDRLVRVQSDSGRAAVATFRALGGGW
ncbi:TolC family protein [Variovorax paradoxus]|uniref:TolC family protein n=1 Tax=Variovorax paradoxus TaxID=34073 RepID=UPI0038D024E0